MSAPPSHYVFWLAGRSAGIVALVVITASVLLGLAMAARAVPAGRRRQALALHQYLALTGLAAIAAHGLLLAADPWLKAGLNGILVPFAIHYRPLWTAMGIIGGYLAALLGLSFYLRRRLPTRVWRRMHRLTSLAYVLALAHSLGSGTDASIPLVRGFVLASAVPVVLLFGLRVRQSRIAAAASRALQSEGRLSVPRAQSPGRPAQHPSSRGTPSIAAGTASFEPSPSQAS